MLKWTLFCLKQSPHDVALIAKMSPRHQGAEFVGMQDDNICLWSMDNNQLGHVTRKFLLAGTGHPFPPCMLDYLGTIFWQGLVLHVFEMLK